jgi:endonuclease/exonuclease/phosphatase family metal-dependent hydrolase
VGQAGQVLIATWNIANLGVHKRRQRDYQVLAEILSWFEIVAVQEVADNLDDFNQVVAALPNHFDVIYSDRAGNDERAAYVYDTRRVALGPKIGEVVIVESDRHYIRLDGITQEFDGFNRNPYIATFQIEGRDILLANCHLYYGPSSPRAARIAGLEKRQLEAYAIARWCDLRRGDRHRFCDDIIALGDFNLPRAQAGDIIFDALRSRGLRLPEHSTRIPTAVSTPSDYDQMVVTPGLTRRVTQTGVFDFDAVIFRNIFNARTPARWRNSAKYYISDHRPLWMQLAL